MDYLFSSCLILLLLVLCIFVCVMLFLQEAYLSFYFLLLRITYLFLSLPHQKQHQSVLKYLCNMLWGILNHSGRKSCMYLRYLLSCIVYQCITSSVRAKSNKLWSLNGLELHQIFLWSHVLSLTRHHIHQYIQDNLLCLLSCLCLKNASISDQVSSMDSHVSLQASRCAQGHKKSFDFDLLKRSSKMIFTKILQNFKNIKQ